MAPSRGPSRSKATKVVAPVKRRPGTSHTSNHRFSSFSSRIASLKIAPLRSRSRPDLLPATSDLSSATSSYFATALREWLDVNLSAHFTEFAEEVLPLSESLPMVLHHEEAIFELLVRAIQGAGLASLEPLTALLGHLAHDLDYRFEGWFERAWETVGEKVRTTEEVEGLEWGFNCLGFLVKYMSRVLLIDGEVARRWWKGVGKWLGREKQRPFVVRFMGEVVGFLLRRAAKEEDGLDRVVGWLLGAFVEDPGSGMYEEGLKVAFTETVKGIKHGVHPDGVLVLERLYGYAGTAPEGAEKPLLNLIKGSLISLVHFTDSTGFEPVLTGILDFAKANQTNERHLRLSAEIAYVAVATRKGSRISDWNTVADTAVSLIKTIDSNNDSFASATQDAALRLLAVVSSYAPITTILSRTSLFATISHGRWVAKFLPFCYLIAEIAPERFTDLLLGQFQKFIVNNWQSMEYDLLSLIPRIQELSTVRADDVPCPVVWQKSMLDAFKAYNNSKSHVLHGYLRYLQSSKCQKDGSKKAIAERIWELIQASPATGDRPQADALLYGDALRFASSVMRPTTEQLYRLVQSAPGQTTSRAYWEAISEGLEQLLKAGDHLPEVVMRELFQNLLPCVRAPSHEMRSVALRALQGMFRLRNESVPELFETIISIEDTPTTVQNARFISSQIRRLGLGYEACLGDSEMSKVVPSYCFGLLHLRLSQAWEDAAQVLKDISKHERAENAITEIVSEWLEGGIDPLGEESVNWSPNEAPPARSDFECSNVHQVEAASANAEDACKDPEERLEQSFRASIQTHALTHSFNRTQALKVMRVNAQLAEKRSRLLVPVLLRWVNHDADEDSDAGSSTVQRWNRKDQKAMLDVFAQFQNPKVLFRSAEVYQALLKLLTNGDAEIQKSALQAVLAWKQPQVIKYQEHLLNFLDDARFREEISVFLRIDEEEGIRPEDTEILAPVLLRLLYGLLINRTGNASGVRGKSTKRKAVFGALTRFPAGTLGQFIAIALDPVESAISQPEEGGKSPEAIVATRVHPRKQTGVLNMANDMFDTLGSELEPFAKRLAHVALSCLLSSSQVTTNEEETSDDQTHASLFKAVRRFGFSCLTQAYTYGPSIDWQDVTDAVIQHLLLPRLDKFVSEMAQSISGMLRLFSVWCKTASLSEDLVRLAPGVLPALIDCLEASICPEAAKIFILNELLAHLLDHVVPDEDVVVNGDGHSCPQLVDQFRQHGSRFLHVISDLMQRVPSKQILDSSLSCTLRLASLITDEKDVNEFVFIGAALLQENNKKVPVPTKHQLLLTMHRLLRGQESHGLINEKVFTAAYQSTSSLFTLFRDREGRQDLCAVLTSLCKGRKDLEQTASLCEDLNAFATAKIEEPDFGRRDVAFAKINEELYTELTAQQWRPLLYNMLFFIRDNDELSIRTSASFTLQRFVEAVEDHLSNDRNMEDMRHLVSKVLVPGIHSGMHQSSELVRSEYLTVLGQMVKRLDSFADLANMVPLLAGNDEEASFFSNLLHVQQHRRMRALRRLASEAEKTQLSSANVANVFLPLLEHFILDAAQDESAHNLTAEAINAVSALTRCLNWSQYKAVLRRYIGLMKDMEGKEKTILRLVGAVINGLYHACSSASIKADGETMDTDQPTKPDGALQRTLPPRDILVSSITEQLLPLTSFLHLKDESTVSLRVPVGVVVVKLLKCLPDDVMITKLPGVLLDLCHILRSRDQGSRDMTRKTLTEITALLGPAYFHFIVKELKSALQRGYQLHVLSFTVHSILVENLGKLQPGDLDHCVADLVLIIMDDIFGVAGQEKDAEEYVSRMKEVKSSKSFDSMELLSKITTLPYLTQLIRPIKALLSEKLDLRTVKKIDELLRRMALGISQNPAVIDRDILVFCYEIVQQGNEADAPRPVSGRPFNDYKTRRYLIQMQSASKSSKKGSTSSYGFKLTRFAVDLLRSVLQRHESLKTPSNIAGFIPIISDALVSGVEEVQLSVLRLLTSIMRVPHPKLDSNASTYVSEAVKIIRAAPAMTTEAAQAALKLIATTLRDRNAATTRIREQDLAYVLKRVKPDLEEPDRQGVIFNFLKCVLGRKIVIAEVYEVMDAVAGIMVTNQTRMARDLARGLYGQFMLDYPLTGGRLEKCTGFLVRNLEFKYPEGRQSVLELLHLLVRKTEGETGQGIAGACFVPLVMVLVNDEDRECREMAGVLIKQVLEKADGEKGRGYVGLLRGWLEQDEQVLLKRVSLQIWKMQVEVGKVGAKDVEFLLQSVKELLPTKDKVVAQDDWELLYYGLQLFGEIAKTEPEVAFAAKVKQIWIAVYRCLIFPHAWVKLAAARLVGVLFGDVGKTNKEVGLGAVPLATSGAVTISQTELRQLCSMSLRVLRYEASSEQLLAQTCRNIVFLGRCFGANGVMWELPSEHSNGVNGHGAEASESESADEEEQEEDEDNEAEQTESKTSLAHLLSTLCSILRRNQSATTPTSLPPKMAALQTLHTLLSHLDPGLYSGLAQTILHPLLVLTDPSIPKPTSTNPAFTEQFTSLTNLAQETMSLLQTKLGSSKYVKEVSKAQGHLRERREDRRVKRRIEAVAQPEKAERRKARKVEAKGRRKKERGEEYKGRRRGW
ncbi:hypothetical protein C1H76_6225 [Elsinoe australis]|uniref:Uncharacterized protein n=1 Tax=Elsinoe australis TaxID=40998 RepID=A0A4U7AUF9_9PEZI|nr:hypothetical protein C1H76_6225 [Elsinoe australis]